MSPKARTLALSTIIAASLSVVGSWAYGERAQDVNPDAAAFQAFSKRVGEYLSLQKKLAGTLPNLPDKATPKELDSHRRALGALVIKARATAKQGDIFGAEMTPIVRRLLAPIFKGPDGRKIREAIFEEPHPAVPKVNARYPDTVPLSTMPPEILKALPKLDEGLEFRFIDRHLILLDPRAHLVVDVIDNAIPA